MMGANPGKFAELLNRGVNQIHARENKPKLVVRDELGYAVGKQGRTAIDYWCRDGGHIPDDLVVEKLAREIVRRKGFDQGELKQFLQSADYPDAITLQEELFPRNARGEEKPEPIRGAETLVQGLSDRQKSMLGQEAHAALHIHSSTLLKSPISIIQLQLPNLPWTVFAFVGMIGIIAIAVVGFGWISNFLKGTGQNSASAQTGLVKLVGLEQRVIVSTQAGVLSSGASVRVNDPVTVRFKILNNDLHPVFVKTLVIGARGPGVRCDDGNSKKWSAPTQPFPTATDFSIEPGQEFEYVGTRVFYEPGTYFVEPNIKDAAGRWGGIQPFTCINLVVVP